jgi:hypothetical protein
MEESVWYVRNYIAEMEGPAADKNPLTMEECARVAEECLLGKIKVRATCTTVMCKSIFFLGSRAYNSLYAIYGLPLLFALG